MSKRHKLWLSFVAATVGGAVLAGATTTEAKFRRQSATFCRPEHAERPISFESGAAANANAYSDMVMVCPLADDSSFAKTEISGLNVHGYDGSTWGNIRAAACVQYYGWYGGACGALAQTGYDTVSDVTLRPSVSEWGAANEHHFPYLFVILSPPQDGRRTKLYGYYVY